MSEEANSRPTGDADVAVEQLALTQSECLELLLQRLRDIRMKPNSQSTPLRQIVLLRASSGAGKSWVMRQLYERLRQESADGATGMGAPTPDPYWPSMSSHTTSRPADVLHERKRLTPEIDDNFVWQRGALPSFGWWSFQCESGRGDRYELVVPHAQEQAATHGLPLAAAQPTFAGLRSSDAWKRFFTSAGRELADITAEEIADLALTATGINAMARPLFVGLILPTLKGATGRLRNKLASAETGEEKGKRAADARAELADNIAQLASPAVPSVIAIEDLHLMGESLGSTLRSLISRKPASNVLIVASAWPEGYSNEPYASWLKDPLVRRSLTIVDLAPVDEEALVSLLRAAAPNTSHEVTRQLLAPRSPLRNPLFLQLWLGSRRVQRKIRDGALEQITKADLPGKAEDVLESRWEELPENVQNALQVAIAACPTSDVLRSFPPGVLRDALLASEELTEEEFRGFVEAVDPANWCRGDLVLQAFLEASLAEVAVSRSGDYFDADDASLRTIRTLVAQTCERWMQAHPEQFSIYPPENSRTDVDEAEDEVSTKLAVLLSQWLTAYSKVGVEVSHEALGHAAWRLAKHAEAAKEFTAAARWSAAALEAFKGSGERPELELTFLDAHRLGWLMVQDALDERRRLAEGSARLDLCSTAEEVEHVLAAARPGDGGPSPFSQFWDHFRDGLDMDYPGGPHYTAYEIWGSKVGRAWPSEALQSVTDLYELYEEYLNDNMGPLDGWEFSLHGATLRAAEHAIDSAAPLSTVVSLLTRAYETGQLYTFEQAYFDILRDVFGYWTRLLPRCSDSSVLVPLIRRFVTVLQGGAHLDLEFPPASGVVEEFVPMLSAMQAWLEDLAAGHSTECEATDVAALAEELEWYTAVAAELAQRKPELDPFQFTLSVTMANTPQRDMHADNESPEEAAAEPPITQITWYVDGCGIENDPDLITFILTMHSARFGWEFKENES